MRLPPTERECARIRSTWRDCTTNRRLDRRGSTAVRMIARRPTAPLMGPAIGLSGTALILAGLPWMGSAMVAAGLAIAFGYVLAAEVADMRRRRWAGQI